MSAATATHPGKHSGELLLVLNAAEGLLQLLLARKGAEAAGWEALAFVQKEAPSQGAEALAPALADMLEKNALAARSISRIAAVRGPGSFTGLRLALATASGLARAAGASRAGLDYLPLLAVSAAFRQPEGPGEGRAPGFERLWVLTHARRNLIHMQGFQAAAQGGLLPLSGIVVLSPDEAVRRILATEEALPGSGPGSALLGSGLDRNREAVAEALNSHAACKAVLPVLLPPFFGHPTQEGLLRLAAEAAFAAKDIEPLYVRGADAEENLERIACSLGIDPARARARFEALSGGSGDNALDKGGKSGYRA